MTKTAKLSSDAYYMLGRAFAKEPILWNFSQFSHLSTIDLVEKVTYAREAVSPIPHEFQVFVATLSYNVGSIPDSYRLPKWKEWAMTPGHAKKLIDTHGESIHIPYHEMTPDPQESDDIPEESSGLTPPLKRRKSSKTLQEPKAAVTIVSKPKMLTGGKRRSQGRVQPEDPVDDLAGRTSPPPVVLSEDIITKTIDDREITPVTTENLLQRTSTDLTLVGVLQVPPPVCRSGCIICASKQISCKHDNKFHTCPGCMKSGYCSCSLDADALRDVKDRVFKEIYSCTPLIQLHEQSFEVANNLITGLTLMLQQAHKSRSAAFANIMNALAHIEENHNTEAAMEEIENTVQSKAESSKVFTEAPSFSPVDSVEEPAPLSPAVDNKSLFFDSPKTGKVFELVPNSDDVIVVLDSPDKLENILHSGPFTSSAGSSIQDLTNLKEPHIRTARRDAIPPVPSFLLLSFLAVVMAFNRISFELFIKFYIRIILVPFVP
ncbi:hypothetical protein EDD18DRAFT_1110696 [Armillaria luteobubalina]|uniref:Uncharacterized protein n=1 Tax=Armillaria luteobubalina TaxID=153913 RepID=A0AA39PPE4_9AGAR|nr:hypothetical protein EDD18DRAFT_1110696 [Armillaria luteobubalina]